MSFSYVPPSFFFYNFNQGVVKNGGFVFSEAGEKSQNRSLFGWPEAILGPVRGPEAKAD